MAVEGNRRSRAKSAAPPAPGSADGRPDVDALLVQAGRGDARAFAAVCDQVSGAVYALVHRIIRDQAQAERVAGEVLVEVWVSAARFNPAEGSGLSWIITMARRQARNQARATGNGSAPGRGPGATEGLEDSQPADPGLASLPGRQREAVLMALWGYNRRQVADLTGVPADTAAEWLRDGLLRLGRRLE